MHTSINDMQYAIVEQDIGLNHVGAVDGERSFVEGL